MKAMVEAMTHEQAQSFKPLGINMHSDRVFDIVIVGGGLVGAAAAVAFAQQTYSVALIDQQLVDQKFKQQRLVDQQQVDHHRIDQRPLSQAVTETVSDNDNWDNRVYALSPGNVDWLKKIGTWDRLNQARVASIDAMEIWGDETSLPLVFDSYAANASSLGVIVENRELLQALWKQMQELGVHLETGVHCDAFHPGMNETELARLKLSNGSSLQAKLVLAADGGNSSIRSQAGIAVHSHEYKQMGLVANFVTELPHHNIARQWFSGDGIMAWLPLPGNRISMVWSTPDTEYLLGLDNEQLASQVEQVGGRALGNLRSLTQCAVFKLVKQTATQSVMPRLVLLGDAAHQIHPLAGQGVNLGFRDAILLSKILSERNRFQDIGDVMLLRKYERSRKADVLALGGLTHGLQWLFSQEQPVLKKLRNSGMDLLNHQHTLKRHLIKSALI